MVVESTVVLQGLVAFISRRWKQGEEEGIKSSQKWTFKSGYSI